MSTIPAPFQPSQRILMGPGPSDVSQRVLRALAAPTIGHLDPEYLKLMDEVRLMLQRLFHTDNALTLAVPGTGSAGMEACLANLIEPGDEVIVCVAGVFGARMKDVAERYGARVHTLDVTWGETLSIDLARAAVQSYPAAKIFAVVHAETSTGAHQPMEELSRVVSEAGMLFVVDAVTSLGGMEVRVDDWKIDACYSGTQKCLSCPPGLAPVTFSDKAITAMDARKTKVANWYLDMSLIRNYWGSDRAYHHTAPINMTYALHEALRVVFEEGLLERFSRHRRNHLALREGLEALGLTYIPERSLYTLNCVRVPAGVNEARVRKELLDRYGIEIGAGLGPFKGQAWRIGLMGSSSSERNILMVLAALEVLLREQKVKVAEGAGVAAAAQALKKMSLVAFDELA
ncbi:MAG: alanine--glyoxylate aminotransferase family protein [Deltaproteobacteria bacterium]|nr:alanine--glyoxylate aminotransferase family protein [Deltaproteobacteria bacterium]